MAKCKHLFDYIILLLSKLDDKISVIKTKRKKEL